MGLVDYSESESDSEQPPKIQTLKKQQTHGPRKIKVELPSLAPEAEPQDERPTKRVRTGGGGFGGFNSLLPAPKRNAETTKKTGSGGGVSLKTSSNAAFSREPVASHSDTQDHTEAHEELERTDGQHAHEPVRSTPAQQPAQENKPAGNAMKFKPLSVGAKKKTSKRPILAEGVLTARAQSARKEATQNGSLSTPQAQPAAPPSKPKVSLFSVANADDDDDTRADTHDTAQDYEPLIDPTPSADPTISFTEPQVHQQPSSDPNSLTSIATDLNLSAADRRRLFGRGAADPSALKIANFNMDAEYARNEEIRAAGETVEHRAVKAVAPGKHSLQQLVNSANTQREALEDKWAEGGRKRGEAGSRYGWG